MESKPYRTTRQHLVKTFLHQGFLVTGSPLDESEIADLVDALDRIRDATADRRLSRHTEDGVGIGRQFGLS